MMDTVVALIAFCPGVLPQRLLLVRKRDVWILPGGKVANDDNGSELTCLHRELREELKVMLLETPTLLGEFQGVTPHSAHEIRVRVYRGLVPNRLTPQREISGFCWVADPLDDSDRPLSELTRHILTELAKANLLPL